MPPGGIPKGGLKAEWGSKGGRGNPFSNPKPGPGIGPPGNPGMPNGGPGRPPGLRPAAAAAAAAEAAEVAEAPEAEDVGVVGGLGVAGLSPPAPDSVDFLPEGAGVDEAELRPLLGLTGSFLALRSPFSLGGVLLSPLVNAGDC